MASWGFLTNHARVLLCIARDPGMRLRDVAARVDITERRAHAIITDLIAAGYRAGPLFKRILSAVEDGQLDGHLHSREEALAFARSCWHS